MERYEGPYNSQEDQESLNREAVPDNVAAYMYESEGLRSELKDLNIRKRFFRAYDSYLGNLAPAAMENLYSLTRDEERTALLELEETRAELACLKARLRPDYIPLPGGRKQYAYDEVPPRPEEARNRLEKQLVSLSDWQIRKQLKDMAQPPETLLASLENEEQKARRLPAREQHLFYDEQGTRGAALGLAFGALVDPARNISIAVTALRLARRIGVGREEWPEKINSAIQALGPDQKTSFEEFG